MSDFTKELITRYGKFLLRPYTNEDEDAILKLWQLAFKKTLDKRIWRWKFHDNPFGREMMLCVDRFEKPVVLFAGIPFPAQWNMKKIIMTQNIDNMSHPNYRYAVSGRRGLFIKTAEYYFDRLGNTNVNIIHYGFPGLKHYKLGNILLNYKEIPVDKTYYELSINKMRRKGLHFFCKVKLIDEFNEVFDVLWLSNRKYYPCSVVRDSKFLNWRFYRNPINDYHTFGLYNIKNKLRGYIVFLIKENSAIIVDIFSPNNRKELNQLLFQSINKLKTHEIKKIKIWTPSHHFIAKSIVDFGFECKKEPLGIVPAYKHFTGNNYLKHFNKFYYTMADGDLF